MRCQLFPALRTRSAVKENLKSEIDRCGRFVVALGLFISFVIISFISWGPITPVIGLISFAPTAYQRGSQGKPLKPKGAFLFETNGNVAQTWARSANEAAASSTLPASAPSALSHLPAIPAAGDPNKAEP